MRLSTWGVLSLVVPSAWSIELNVDDDASIRDAAKTIAAGMVQYYTGYKPGDVPGNLPDPYYWWEAGAMFGALVDYQYYTGDKQYNDITMQAMLHQAGPNNDFMPVNQTRTLGNDDQGFWGITAMMAAENNFPDPPSDKPGWLALAQAVFQTTVVEWKDEACGGGLKWQKFSFNGGYNYKNTISNGCFFNIAARLAKYTGNTTYSEWAEKTWDWMSNVGLISDKYHFYDGSDDKINCTEINHLQWTYNAGVNLYGAAVMWNITGDEKWRIRTQGILDGTDVFYHPEAKNVMYEVACEQRGTCDVDQRSFKAYLARWMSATAQVAPWSRDFVMLKLRTSAAAAAKACVGGADGQQCGLKWTTGTFDGSVGVGEQMAALEVVQGLLAPAASGPVTNTTGGTSQGDPNAGAKGVTGIVFDEVTTGDKAGAGILTALVLTFLLGGGFWMVTGV